MKVIYDDKDITSIWVNCLKYTLTLEVLALTKIKTPSPYTAKIYDFHWISLHKWHY